MRRALVLLLLCGCSKTPEPPKGDPPQPPPAHTTPAVATGAAAEGTPSPHGGEVVWETPAAWTKKENPNAMRKATYGVPKAPGDAEDTELAVSRAGGSVSANVDRWVTQFAPGAKVDKTERTVNGLTVTVVEIRGTFAGGGMPGMPSTGPKEHYVMLGAIAVDDGQDSTFFKMTGPEKTVGAARADFDKLVESLKKG